MQSNKAVEELEVMNFSAEDEPEIEVESESEPDFLKNQDEFEKETYYGTSLVGKKTDKDIAIYIAQKNRPLVYFSGRFWSSRGNMFRCVDSQIIKECHNLSRNGGKNIVEILRATQKIEQESVYMRYVKRQGQIEKVLTENLEPADINTHQIVFADGILDVSYDIFTPFTETGYCLFGPTISLKYNPRRPRSDYFENYVKAMFPDDEYRKFFQRMMGAILAPHNQIRGYYLFIGPAKCGKSSLALAIAQAPAGGMGYTTKTEYALVTDKWEAQDLGNKFVNVSNDSAFSTKWEPWIKQYTSGRINVQGKFKDVESILPTAKIISTTNYMHQFNNISGSFSDRVYPFVFEHKVKETEKADKTKYLSEDFWSKHREGIVYWLLEGYKDFLDKGYKNPPPIWTEQKTTLFEDSNPIEEWLKDSIKPDEESFLVLNELIATIPQRYLSNSDRIDRLIVVDAIFKLFGKTKIRDRSRRDSRDKYGFEGLKI